MEPPSRGHNVRAVVALSVRPAPRIGTIKSTNFEWIEHTETLTRIDCLREWRIEGVTTPFWIPDLSMGRDRGEEVGQS